MDCAACVSKGNTHDIKENKTPPEAGKPHKQAIKIQIDEYDSDNFVAGMYTERYLMSTFFLYTVINRNKIAILWIVKRIYALTVFLERS